LKYTSYRHTCTSVYMRRMSHTQVPPPSSRTLRDGGNSSSTPVVCHLHLALRYTLKSNHTTFISQLPGWENHSEIHELQTHLHEKNILYASSTALISHLAGWGQFTLDPHKACFAMLFLITTASIHRPHLATRGVGAIRVKHTQAIF
jgi:hypothetical protein